MKGTTPNPYVGPRPFKSSDARRFFGRERDTEDLLATITAHQVTLLYAESGAGKTSLLQARIIPGLIDDHCQLLLRNREKDRSKPPDYVPARVRPVVNVPADVSPRNVFSMHALASIKDDVPVSRLAQMTIASWRREEMASLDEATGMPPPRVLIFDQFEEVFTTSVERWDHRRGFFRDISEALHEDPRLRVVFAMREEYIANFDPFLNELPGNGRTRFRLERLRKVDALKAVIGPMTQTDVRFGQLAPRMIVRSLRRATSTGAYVGEYVEPLHLQVVCHRLWESLPPETEVISSDLIDVHADVEKSLEEYYEECVVSVAKQGEVTEAKVRGFFERYLITPEKTRGIVHSEEKITGNLDTEIVALIDEQFYLIRPEFRGSARWYELSHDRLVHPILSSNAKWRQSRQGGEMLTVLEQRARAHGAGEVLTLEELEKFDRWKAATSDSADFELSSELTDWITKSRLEHERSRTARMVRERRYMAAGLILLALLLGSLLWVRQLDVRKTQLEIEQQKLIALKLDAEKKRQALIVAQGKQEAAFATQQRDASMRYANLTTQARALSDKQHFDCLVRDAKANLPKKPAVALARAVMAYVACKRDLPQYLHEADAVLLKAVDIDEAGANSWRLRRPQGMDSISISHDRKHFLTASPREYCKWDLDEMRLVGCKDLDNAGEVTVSPGGTLIHVRPRESAASLFSDKKSSDEMVLTWNDDLPVSAADKSAGEETLLAIAPDDSFFVWGTDGKLLIRKRDEDNAGREIPVVENDKPASLGDLEVKVAASGDRLLVMTSEHVYLTPTKSGSTSQPLMLVPEVRSPSTRFTFSANGKRLLITRGGEQVLRVLDTATMEIYFDQAVDYVSGGDAVLSPDGMKLIVIDNAEGGKRMAAWEYDVSTAERGHDPPVMHVISEMPGEAAQLNGNMLIGFSKGDDGSMAVEAYDPMTRHARRIGDRVPNGDTVAFERDVIATIFEGDAYVFDGNRRDRPGDSPLRRACTRLCMQDEWNEVSEVCKANSGFDCDAVSIKKMTAAMR